MADRDQGPDARRIGHRGDRRQWLKQGGRRGHRRRAVFELETDKVTVEVPAPGGRHAGRDRASRKAPTVAGRRACSCRIEAGAARRAAAREARPPHRPRPRRSRHRRLRRARRRCRRPPTGRRQHRRARVRPRASSAEETGVDAVARSSRTGKDGRVTKADVLAALSSMPGADGASGQAGRAGRPALAPPAARSGVRDDPAAPHASPSA